MSDKYTAEMLEDFRKYLSNRNSPAAKELLN